MPPRRRAVTLFLLGTAIAIGLQLVFAMQNGGAGALLHVGAESELREQITGELGMIRLWPEQGHDGKFSYAIARAPFSFEDPLVDHPAYRYRRYLYSLLAGGFGSFPPVVTLYGLMAVAAVGYGLVAAGADALGRSRGAAPWSSIAGLVNLGILGGVLQLSSDPLAFGLSMVGAAAWLRDRRAVAVILFVLAVWSKEVYLLVPLGIAGWELWERRPTRAMLVVAAPGAFAAAWWLALTALFPETSTTNSAFTVPFAGIWNAAQYADTGFSLGSQLTTLVLILAGGCAAIVARDRLLLTLTGAWIVLAVISHEQIWHQDSMRAFAPLFTFAALAIVIAIRRYQQTTNDILSLHETTA